MLFQNIIKRKEKLGDRHLGGADVVQRPQIEDALPAPPYSSIDALPATIWGPPVEML
jgi:hypothetical protein